MKKLENKSHSHEKRRSVETNHEIIQMLELSNKAFNATIITVLREVKKNMQSMKKITGNLSRKIKTIERTKQKVQN